MKKKKNTVLYLSILGVVVIVLLLVGKKAGWFGKEMAMKVAVEKS